MNGVHRSIGFSAIDRYGSTLFQVISLAILARLLKPEEFGVYTAIAAFTALANVAAREFGGANYLIQKPHLDEENIRTAFTISFAMSVAFAAVLFSLRDIAAAFYAQPGLKMGISVAALNFFFVPISGTVSALLRRELKFNVIAMCNLTANFAAAVTSVTLAGMSFSFMSPILGSTLGQIILMGLYVSARRTPRIFTPSVTGWREVMGFGTYSSAVAIINTLYQASPQLIVGRVLGFTAVGLYGRAVNITQLFDKLVLDVLNPVIMPAIADQSRAGADLKSVYLRAVELLTAVQWPFLVFTTITADSVVSILLGPGWHETVPLIRVLCLASLALFAACLTYPTLVAIGRIKDTLTATLISVPASLAIIFAASFLGLHAVAAAALVTLPLQAMVALSFISRRLSITSGDWFAALSKSVVIVLMSAAAGVIVAGLSASGSAVPLLRLSETGAAAFAGWYFGLVLTRHPLLAHIRLVIADMLKFASSKVRVASVNE